MEDPIRKMPLNYVSLLILEIFVGREKKSAFFPSYFKIGLNLLDNTVFHLLLNTAKGGKKPFTEVILAEFFYERVTILGYKYNNFQFFFLFFTNINLYPSNFELIIVLI